MFLFHVILSEAKNPYPRSPVTGAEERRANSPRYRLACAGGRVRPVAHDVRRYGTCVRVAGGHWPPLRVGACGRVRTVAHDVRRYRALRQRADVGIRPYGLWRTLCAATEPFRGARCAPLQGLISKIAPHRWQFLPIAKIASDFCPDSFVRGVIVSRNT